MPVEYELKLSVKIVVWATVRLAVATTAIAAMIQSVAAFRAKPTRFPTCRFMAVVMATPTVVGWFGLLVCLFISRPF